MNILVVSQYYFPEQFRVNDICESLVCLGHKVTVLTGLPNYPKGEIFDGYLNEKKRDECINGVHIIRCNIVPRKKDTLHLILNYFSYAFNGWIKIGQINEMFDVVFVYQLSPVTMAIPALKIKRKYGIPIVLYCLDLWPASVLDLNIKRNGIVYNIVRSISRKIYIKSDKLIVTSPSFINYLHEVCHVELDKMSYIPQHAEDIYIKNLKKEKNNVIDFVFLGNIGLSQNCDCIVNAVEKLEQNAPFLVHFVGEGICLKDIQKLVQDKRLEKKILFHGFQTLENLKKFYQIADVCLLTLSNETEIGVTIPAKLQGYMAAGKAVAAAISGDAAKVIKDSRCGFQVESGDVDGLANIMTKFIESPQIIDELGENGRRYFDINFTKKAVIEKLETKLGECMQ